jgi:hypothetical protein
MTEREEGIPELTPPDGIAQCLPFGGLLLLLIEAPGALNGSYVFLKWKKKLLNFLSLLD